MPGFNQRFGLNRYAADEYYHRALAAIARRDYDRAIAALNDAIAELPRNAEYIAARGLVHLEEAEYDEAEADFVAALDIDKFEMLANYGLGIIALKRQEYHIAVKYLQSAYYIDQKRPETLYALGVAFYQSGDLVNATQFMGKANELFEKANDKRKSESARWLRELANHVAKPARPVSPALPTSQQQPLPMSDKSSPKP